MQKKVQIISDGSQDLSSELSKEKDIEVVPFYVSFDGDENTACKECSLAADTYDHNILSSHYLSPSLTNLIASNLHRLLQSPHPVHMVSSIWIVLSAFLVIAGQPGFIHIPHFLHLSGSSA